MRLSAERRAGTGSPPGPPVLRVVEVAQVCVHEDPDRRRVARLREALLRDGVLRNPPVVTLLPDGRFAVLDGANRVTALQGLGIHHLVAQVVDYHSPEIILLTWRHYVVEDGPPLLRMRLSQRGDLPMEPLNSLEEAEARVGQGDGVAVVADADGASLLLGHDDVLARARRLCQLVTLYRDGSPIQRVDGGDVDTLRAQFGPGSLVLFRPFSKEEILVIASGGGRLPSGITRHVIPGRALRVNTPLEWLAAPRPLAEKQVHLEGMIRQRWQEHGVRYYAEPTFLFDE